MSALTYEQKRTLTAMLHIHSIRFGFREEDYAHKLALAMLSPFRYEPDYKEQVAEAQLRVSDYFNALAEQAIRDKLNRSRSWAWMERFDEQDAEKNRMDWENHLHTIHSFASYIRLRDKTIVDLDLDQLRYIIHSVQTARNNFEYDAASEIAIHMLKEFYHATLGH